MESNYNNENFERLLRESSDQYRMYPSESVWKNVYSALHTRRRWFGVGFILLLSAGFVTVMMMTNSGAASHLSKIKKTSVELEQPITTGNAGDEKILLTTSNDDIAGASPLNKPDIFQTQQYGVGDKNSPLTDLSLTNDVGDRDLMAGEPVTSIETGVIGNEQVSGNESSPINVVISDPATDQDSWHMKTGGLLAIPTAEQVAPYKIQGSNYPMTIESVINSYKRRNKKLSFQFYFTPTISYRKLSENKSSAPGGTSTASIYGNINNAVTHKPDMGLELGVAARYTLSNKIKLRAGLQFNTSRYDIKAFSYAAEVTTIALNTGNYSTDSVNTISSYRNFNGYKSDWIHNFYFQVSAPIGIEMKLAGDDKMQFGIGTSFQPTYVLGDRVYLLSSNYKNYAEVPSLIRKWNVNASFEAFVSYSTGKMNWQVGPQIRYQLQSSFVNVYPVKENLFDFGLKIAVSPNK